MPADAPSPENLHGSVPDQCRVVLLLVDWINAFDFPGSENLLEHALPAARAAADLKRRARAAGVPVVYVNDNFGRWKSDFTAVVEHCRGGAGKGVVDLLAPDGDDDYFVLKPKHSGFFHTTLDLLLQKFRAETLVLTGVAGNICVLFTANDAYLRDFKLVVPPDAIASEDAGDNAHALRQMQRFLKAELTPSGAVDLAGLRDGR